MTVLGLILARGGSKRVPRKNVRMLGDAPLLAWTIVPAHHALSLDCVVVSSDDPQILGVAQVWGADTIRRPLEMATDEASPYPAMLHALDVLDEAFDYLCLLQPTSPFRTNMDIDGCVAWAMRADGQALPAVATRTVGEDVPNGAVYVGRTDWLRDGGNFDGPAVGSWLMPPERSLDIDTEEDWAEAEAMVARLAA